MDINKWLEEFKENWQNHNISKILELFDKNVIYFETPFQKLKDFNELSKAWESVENQKDIQLEFKIFSSCQNKHSVIWKLIYKNQDDLEKTVAGTYLIELNDAGLCTYFHHSCETLR